MIVFLFNFLQMTDAAVVVNVLVGCHLLVWGIISVWHRHQLFYGNDCSIPRPGFEFD